MKNDKSFNWHKRVLIRFDYSGKFTRYSHGFRFFSKAGVALGSGALLICDEDTCVVDLARVLLNFFRKKAAENVLLAGLATNVLLRF